MARLWRLCALFAVVLFVHMLGGCASTGAAGGTSEIDPWEKNNRFFYKLNDNFDRATLKPMSEWYVRAVPKPIRTGLGNGFDNLGYFNVILNDFLQGNWKQGWSDAGRMATNSTIGVAGIFDVASGWGMVSHDNDFGITLGKWGAAPGPYMVLPFFGPTTVRDAPGIGVGFATDPTTWLNLPMKIVIPLYLTEAIDTRARAVREFRFREAASIDSYVFTRDAYLQYRDGQINAIKPQSQKSIYDEDNDETQPASQPATRPAIHSAK